MRKFSMITYISILFVLSLPVMSCFDSGRDGNFLNITPQEAEKIISSDENVVIIDVRTPDEYDSGHIEGSLLIDYYSETFKDQLEELDKEQFYLIYCRSGNRSGKALSLMKNLGFKKVYNIKGGVIEWRKSKQRLTID